MSIFVVLRVCSFIIACINSLCGSTDSLNIMMSSFNMFASSNCYETDCYDTVKVQCDLYVGVATHTNDSSEIPCVWYHTNSMLVEVFGHL